MSNDKVAATFHPHREIQMTDKTQRKSADETAEILRSQGATEEQIKEYQDHAGTAVPTEGQTNEPQAKGKQK
jgi:hypothetical protein